jgi:hypothetical protein
MEEGTNDFWASEDDFTGPSGVMGGRAITLEHSAAANSDWPFVSNIPCRVRETFT